MLKRLSVTCLYWLLILAAKGQAPVFKSNTSGSDLQNSVIYKNFAGKCDFIIAYANESYWWSNIQSYKLLVLNNGVWSKGLLFSKRRKNNTWKNPKISLKPINADSGAFIVKYLENAGFYMLNRDSLNIHHKKINDTVNQEFSVSDGINYKFEIMSKNNFLIVESYMPEYFLEKIPEIKSRAIFIKCRDTFLSAYKRL